MIIGISGPMHSGKTALAKELSKTEGYIQESFANPVKDLVKHMGLPVSRKYLQLMGQGARELIHEGVWVNSLQARLKPLHDYVIDDVRYPNELEACDLNIRLECGVWGQWERYQQSPKFDPNIKKEEWLTYTTHETEKALDTVKWIYDLVIQTDNLSLEQVFADTVRKLEVIHATRFIPYPGQD